MKEDFRYELKFVLNDRQMIRARSWLATESRTSTRHPPRIVNSLYYDTADLRSLTDNLYGIASRKKHRLRWYSDHHDGEEYGVCFEVKQRSERVSMKRREALPAFSTPLSDSSHRQVRERLLHSLRGIQGLERIAMYFPTLQIQYSREYFEDAYGLRVTLDQGIVFFPTPLAGSLFYGRGIRYPWCVMEIKFPRQIKNGVAATIRGFRISPQRHSKYAAGLAALGQATYF